MKRIEFTWPYPIEFDEGVTMVGTALRVRGKAVGIVQEVNTHLGGALIVAEVDDDFDAMISGWPLETIPIKGYSIGVPIPFPVEIGPARKEVPRIMSTPPNGYIRLTVTHYEDGPRTFTIAVDKIIAYEPVVNHGANIYLEGLEQENGAMLVKETPAQIDDLIAGDLRAREDASISAGRSARRDESY